METYLFFLSSVCLILVGICAALASGNLLRVLLGVKMAETGVCLLLVCMGYSPQGRAPLLPGGAGRPQVFVDPLPQELALVSMVVGFGATALALALILKSERRRRSRLQGGAG